ncbi:hypothetical protein Tco_0593981 [Tanacetum coccineum]
MGIILGGYDQRDGKISYHLGEIHNKDDPTLVRKNRHVKKPSYAAMGSGESFALTVLSNYNANSTGIGSTFTQHHTRGLEHDTHNLVIKPEAYELFKWVYRHVLDENNIIKLYVGLNMLNDLHLGGFDARAFIHKFSRIDDLLARSGFLLLCNIDFVCGHVNKGRGFTLFAFTDRS